LVNLNKRQVHHRSTKVHQIIQTTSRPCQAGKKAGGVVAEVTAQRQRPPLPGLSGREVPAQRGLADSGARHEGAAPGPFAPSTCRGSRTFSTAWRRTAWRK
jgi:hypothetical protein